MRLRNLSSKINCCFRSAQAQSASRRRRSDDARSVSSSRRNLNSSGSSTSSGISLASSTHDDQVPRTSIMSVRSPALSSGYHSGHELSPSQSSAHRVYVNQPGSLRSTTKTQPRSSQQIESLKRLQELELIKFNQKQALLCLEQSDSDDYNYESLLARKLEKSSLTNADSGISTLGAGCAANTDADSAASDATSNLSTYLSSSPIFSSASSSASLAEWSPFPKVINLSPISIRGCE